MRETNSFDNIRDPITKLDRFIYPWVDDAEEGNEHATWTPITLIEKRKSMREQRGRGTKLDKVGDMLRDLSFIKVLGVK